MQSHRDATRTESNRVTSATDQDLMESFISLVSAPTTSTQSTPLPVNNSYRLFYRSENLPPPLGTEADDLVYRMKTVLLEIHLIKEVILPTLDDSPCNIRHVLFSLPKELTLEDEAIRELKKLCANNIRLLNALKYTRDGIFTTGKAVPSVGIMALLIAPSLGLELILLGLCVAAVILYLDKYTINRGQARDHFFPTREDIFDSARYKLLIEKYTFLQDRCDEWLSFDPVQREEYQIKDSEMPSDELTEKGLRLAYTQLRMK